MNIEATAEALAPETAVPVEAPVVEETPSEDAQLEALYDGIPDDETPNEQAEAAPVEADLAAEPETPAEPVAEVTPPSEVPGGVKDHWADIPQGARDAILTSQRDMSRKLSDQGREIQAISPIKDVLVQAVQELPSMAGKLPQDAAKEVFELAKISNEFNTNPLKVMTGLIKKHGLEQQLSQHLSGQQVTAGNASELKQTIAGLERKIEQLTDPQHFKSRVEQATTEATLNNEVIEFAGQADHWDAVEEHMPLAISLTKAKLGEGASGKDVLTQAYDLAVSQFLPDAKVTPEPVAEQAAPVVDPERSKAAIKAKSVNVRGTQSGKGRTLTEDELLSSTFDKLQN